MNPETPPATSPFDHEQPDVRFGGDRGTASGWGIEYAEQPAPGAGHRQQAFPIVDIIDRTDEIIAFVDVPGFSEDDIRVRIDQQTLVIEADRAGEIDETDTVIARERPTSVERVIQLPAAVRAGGAEAELDDGVCVISLPKAATDRYEEIRVKSD